MTWWCTYCGKPHTPDSQRGVMGYYTHPDERYALAECHGTRRTLVKDREQAELASRTMGKFAKAKPARPVNPDDLYPPARRTK